MIIRPQPEVAEVIRSCYDEFLERYGKGLTPEQRRTLDDLARCRTAALGGHVLECPDAGIGRSPITPVGIAIAPSARPPPRPMAGGSSSRFAARALLPCCLHASQ